MAEPMDALKSFTHLADNVPEWLSKLDELAIQVADQRSRFARMSQSHFTKYRLSKKHDSTESLRPPKDDLDDPVDIAGPVLLVDTFVPPTDNPPTSQPNVTTTPLPKEIQRKRKPASNLSISSGPQKYRTRTMIIVYYDSAIQAAFEDLVRCIAGARNNLRKGKTAATFKARMLSIGMGDGDDDDSYPNLNPKMMIKRYPRSSPDAGPRFDQADGDLEAAQSLCEVAAHQFLRDGDCVEELEGTRKRFEDCLKVAREEVEKLEKEKARDNPADAPETSVDATEPIKVKTASAPVAAQKLDVPRISVIPTMTSSGTIEVDDESDGSSVHIDLTAFRSTRRI